MILIGKKSKPKKIGKDGHKRGYYYTVKYKCKKCHKNKTLYSAWNRFKHKCICSSCFNKQKHNKKICLRFYKEHEAKTFPSITEFCNKHSELGNNAKYHFADVLNGKRLHYKGWLDGKNINKISLEKVKKIEQILLFDAIIK